MSWWTTPGKFELKQKSKFIVSFANDFFLPNVKTCTKPSLEINTKDFKLLNHHFNYPGIVKWNPIRITFVDVNANGDQFDTAGFLSQMLNNTGYNTPDKNAHSLSTGGGDSTGISSPEKSSTIANAFGGGLAGQKDDKSANYKRQNVLIQMLTPDGAVNEKWTLVNPLIKSMKFGDLAYDSDEAIEYELEIVYDFAIYGEA
tara:strand:- start:2324 stop:2926 length:603 start_codon:yes stop_codon:yes gene_type:complete